MNKNNESNHPRNKNHSQVDWDRMDEIWYVAGFGTVQLDESMFASGGKPNWTVEDMDNVFLNKAKIQAEHAFPIKWNAFEQRYGAKVYRMGRTSLLEAVLAFSKNEDSLKPTDDYYDEIENRLGVLLSLHGDDFSSMLPDFYHAPLMTAEDFFFDQFLPTKLKYIVCDPVKFATWVKQDRRWDVLVTMRSI